MEVELKVNTVEAPTTSDLKHHNENVVLESKPKRKNKRKRKRKTSKTKINNELKMNTGIEQSDNKVNSLEKNLKSSGRHRCIEIANFTCK